MINIIRDKEFKPIWRQSVNSEAYHQDKTAIGSTTLKTILKSPKHFLASYTEVKQDTEAFRFGRMFHEALLEPHHFTENYKIEPVVDMRTKLGKETRAEFEATLKPHQGRITQIEFDKIQAMIAAIQAHKDYKFLQGGIAECAGYYADPETGILCKVRPDYFNPEYNLLVDIKTTQDCNRESFAKDIAKFRYQFQMGMYLEGVEQIMGIPVSHGMYVVVEKTFPYQCAFYRVDDIMRQQGVTQYRRALDTLATCMETNTWSPYQTDYQTISLPTWAIE